jgi:SAM-dependent methyltransferase
MTSLLPTRLLHHNRAFHDPHLPHSHMSFSRYAQFFRSATTPLSRSYSSLNAKIPYNFFSIFGMANVAAYGTGPFPATPYKPMYDNWPYEESDFKRYDEDDDGVFYSQARLVTHIDDSSIKRLTDYYGSELPRKGRILDMCTSWKSFYPSEVEEAVREKELEVFGVGLNAAEMKVNGVFGDAEHWRVLDLNKAPHDVRSGWQGKDLKFDAVTCVVSIDYLNKPLEVCKNLLEATNEGGKVHLVISNRCFPNKVVRRWMELSEQSRLEFVGGKLSIVSGVVHTDGALDYLHFSGWKDVEIVDLCARDESGMRVTDDHGTTLIRSPYLPSHLDPLWVVRATKVSASS